eukprot:17840-Heterococcus_DN1.PRE.2
MRYDVYSSVLHCLQQVPKPVPKAKDWSDICIDWDLVSLAPTQYTYNGNTVRLDVLGVLSRAVTAVAAAVQPAIDVLGCVLAMEYSDSTSVLYYHPLVRLAMSYDCYISGSGCNLTLTVVYPATCRAMICRVLDGYINI